VTLTERELQDLYRHATAKGAERHGCPDAETLVRLASGELEKGASSAAVDHLADCSECAGEYALLDPLRQWADGVAAPYDEGGVRRTEENAWPGYWRALAAAAVLAVVGLSSLNVWQWRRSESARSRLSEALADAQSRRAAERDAASRQIADLNRAVAGLSRPQINVPIIDLEASGPFRGPGRGAMKRIDLPAGIRFFNVVLYVSDSTMYESYRLIVDRDGVEIWRGEGLQRSGYDTFTVSLPAAMFRAGRYRLTLHGASGKGHTTVQEYEIEINYG
jgi:hypothetical protein